MTFRFRSLAVVALFPTIAAAQQIGQLPRTTPTTGLADSALFLCTDSTKAVTRACKFSDVQKRLSFKAFDSLLTTKLNLTGGTITGSPTWSSTFTAASGQRVDSATGAARAQILTTARTIGGTSFNGSANIVPGLSDSATGAARAQILTTARTIGGTSFNGSANIVPGLSDSATGAVRSQTLTTARTLWGVSFDGSANLTAAPTFGLGATVSNGQTLALGTSTVSGTPTWSSVQAFAATQRVDSATGAARSQALTTARTLWGASFDGTANVTAAPTFGAGATVSSGQTFTVTGATITGLTAASVGSGAFPSGTYSFTGATALTGGAGNMTLTAGTGASRTLTLQATTSGSATKNVVVVGADSSTTFLGLLMPAATASRDLGTTSVKWRAGYFSSVLAAGEFDVNSGNGDYISQTGAGVVSFYSGGFNGLNLSGGASATLAGGAGSMTVTAGTGASRTMTLQSSNSSSAATTFAIGSGDTLKLSGHLIATGLTSEGSTQSALCVTNGGGQVFINAAATCTVSSARFKENIVPIDAAAAWKIVGKSQLHSSTYNERVGGRKAIGIVAEQADSADTRLASRDAKGVIASTNYEEVTSLLLTIVKDQQRQLDSLKTVLKGKKP